MNDLIWVGNALYPRWFVFLVIFIVIFVAAGILSWLTR